MDCVGSCARPFVCMQVDIATIQPVHLFVFGRVSAPTRLIDKDETLDARWHQCLLVSGANQRIYVTHITLTLARGARMTTSLSPNRLAWQLNRQLVAWFGDKNHDHVLVGKPRQAKRRGKPNELCDWHVYGFLGSDTVVRAPQLAGKCHYPYTCQHVEWLLQPFENPFCVRVHSFRLETNLMPSAGSFVSNQLLGISIVFGALEYIQMKLEQYTMAIRALGANKNQTLLNN